MRRLTAIVCLLYLLFIPAFLQSPASLPVSLVTSGVVGVEGVDATKMWKLTPTAVMYMYNCYRTPRYQRIPDFLKVRFYEEK